MNTRDDIRYNLTKQLQNDLIIIPNEVWRVEDELWLQTWVRLGYPVCLELREVLR